MASQVHLTPIHDTWRALDRAYRAIARARTVADRESEHHPGDAARIIRGVADDLLRCAARYDVDAGEPACCPECGATEYISCLAWVDADTREHREWVDPDEIDCDLLHYCGTCCEAVAP